MYCINMLHCICNILYIFASKKDCLGFICVISMLLCYKERILVCYLKHHSQRGGRLDRKGFGRGKLGRMMYTQGSTLEKYVFLTTTLEIGSQTPSLVVLISMKAYNMPFSALNLWGHFIWLKNNWFFYYYAECFSSSPLSENESSWKRFLPCYVQIKPDLIVIALDKCHSIKWSRGAPLISLGGWKPLFCPAEFFFSEYFPVFSTISYCARFEALSPLHSDQYLYSQLKSKTEIYLLPSFRGFCFLVLCTSVMQSSEAQNSLPLTLLPNM